MCVVIARPGQPGRYFTKARSIDQLDGFITVGESDGAQT